MTYVFDEIRMRCDTNLNFQYFYDRIIVIRATDEYWSLRFVIDVFLAEWLETLDRDFLF